MQSIKLEAKTRKKGEKNNNTRLIPSVVYGKGLETKSLWVDSGKLGKIISEVGESTLIDLTVGEETKSEARKVLIQDTQSDPLSGNLIHADFFQVRMDEEIEAGVALEFVGESSAVKEKGGILVKNMDEVEVRCLPAKLPGSISVDVSNLKTFEDRICLKDLKISEGVEFMIDPETVVAIVTPPRSEEELKELESEVESDISQVEGIKEEQKAETAAGETQSEQKGEETENK